MKTEFHLDLLLKERVLSFGVGEKAQLFNLFSDSVLVFVRFIRRRRRRKKNREKAQIIIHRNVQSLSPMDLLRKKRLLFQTKRRFFYTLCSRN